MRSIETAFSQSKEGFQGCDYGTSDLGEGPVVAAGKGLGGENALGQCSGPMHGVPGAWKASLPRKTG